MKNFYEKLKAMDPQKFLTLQWCAGIFAGLLCWASLRAESFIQDGLLKWSFIIVFAIIMLGSGKISKDTGLNIMKFRLAMAVGLGACIVIFAVVYFLITKQGSGLIEIIFNITPKG